MHSLQPSSLAKMDATTHKQRDYALPAGRTVLQSRHLLSNIAGDVGIPVPMPAPQPVPQPEPGRHECKCLCRHSVSSSCIACILMIQPDRQIWCIHSELVQKVCRVWATLCRVPLTTQLFRPVPMQFKTQAELSDLGLLFTLLSLGSASLCNASVCNALSLKMP